jgi:hypothetical protein
MEERITNRTHLKLLSLSILAATACLFSSCVVQTRTSFIPKETSDKVEFFGLYVVEIECLAGKTADELELFPALIKPKVDSTMIESIPRFVIDSVCLEADCLGTDKPYCMGTSHRPDDGQPNGDLYFDGGSVVFFGFFSECGDFVRKNCRDKEVAVTLYARSLDRRTGKVLASEVKTGSYLIKVKSHLHSAGDF